MKVHIHAEDESESKKVDLDLDQMIMVTQRNKEEGMTQGVLCLKDPTAEELVRSISTLTTYLLEHYDMKPSVLSGLVGMDLDTNTFNKEQTKH